MSKVAILYTTFLRDGLMFQTVKSILDNWHKDFILLVGDQGSQDPQKLFFCQNYDKVKYFTLPFDCGLSFARNSLVQRASALGCDYSIITADSIKFIPETIRQLDNAIEFMNSHQDIGILGFDLRDRTPWEFDMDLKEGKFILTKNNITHFSNGLITKECDICRNFFLARTKALLQVRYDNDLKLCEHEDFHWRFKQSGWRVRWTADIAGQYINEKSEEYLQYRQRMYQEFRNILMRKYHLNDWVEYR